MIRLYFQQALYHLRENPIITWVSVLGTALAICMIMVLVITFQVRLVDCEPEVNSQPFAVCVCHVRQEQGRERRRFIQRPHVGAYGARVL